MGFTITFKYKVIDMSRWFLIVTALVFCGFVTEVLGQDTLMVESEVDKVTVYETGAEVERKAAFNLSAGMSLLLFKQLSPEIKPSSIQVDGKGNMTILSIENRTRVLEQKELPAIAETYGNEVEEINEQILFQQKLIDVYAEEKKVLLEHRALAGTKGLETNRVEKAANLWRSRLDEIVKLDLAANKLIRNLQANRDSINVLIADLQPKPSVPYQEILVLVKSSKAQKAKMTLSYFVNKAGWTPQYDARVNAMDEPLDFTFKANVYQNTQEEWKDVSLTIATGQPNENQQLGELYPEYVRYEQRYEAPKVATQPISPISYDYNMGNAIKGKIMDEYGELLPFANVSYVYNGQTYGTQTDFDGNFVITNIPIGTHAFTVTYIGYNSRTFSATVYSNRTPVFDIVMNEGSVMLLESVVISSKSDRDDKRAKKEARAPKVIVKRNLVNVTYEIEEPYSIPSDGKYHVVIANQIEIPAIYEHFVVPSKSKHAYLTAIIPNWEEYNFIDGPLSLFVEGKFTGNSKLNAQNVTDSLEISLGLDKTVIVKREKVKDYREKKVVGTKKVETHAYRINIRNTKKAAIHLTVSDQIPLSGEEGIEVKLEKKDKADYDEEKGFLTWEYDLPPGSTQSHDFKYTIKYGNKKRIEIR